MGISSSGNISSSGTLIANAITLPDNAISGDKVEGGTINSITINTLGGALDVNNENITNIDVDSGTIDGTIIGGASAVAGTFTDLTATKLNVTHLTSSFITASTIETHGSHIFGDSISDTQELRGHITASGNISASRIINTSRLRVDNFIALDSSGDIGSLYDDSTINNIKIGRSGAHITASGNISASGTQHSFGGSVGIGDADPPQALSVVGNILLQPNAENDSFIHANNDLAISSDAGVLIVADTNDTSGVAVSDIIFGAGSAVDTNGNKDFTFAQAYPSVVPRLEAMRIKGDTQNVGIGTTSPAGTLHISSSTDPNLILEDPNGSSLLRFRSTSHRI